MYTCYTDPNSILCVFFPIYFQMFTTHRVYIYIYICIYIYTSLYLISIKTISHTLIYFTMFCFFSSTCLTDLFPLTFNDIFHTLNLAVL